jgi:hypothetical protein
MLVDDIHDVEVQLRTFPRLLEGLGNLDMDDDTAYGLYLFGNMIVDNVKTIKPR